MESLYFVSCNDHEIPMSIICPDTKNLYPCVLMIHGFLSDKNGDGYMLKHIGEALVKEGIASCRIDLVSMGENLYSRQNYGMKVFLQEIEAVFNYLKQLDFIDENHIGILGHSLGGRATFLSCKLPSSILISLNGDIGADSSIPLNLDEDYTIYETSDGRAELLYKRFYEELNDYKCNEIFNYKNLILICVGMEDPTINPHISYHFLEKCGMNNVESILIPTANHTFQAKTKDYTILNQLIKEMIPWISSHI